MKVLCIDDKDRPGEYPGGWNVKEGEIYTVVGEGISSFKETPLYLLAEDPDQPEYGYDKDRFIPISDIDETTFNRNYEKEKV